MKLKIFKTSFLCFPRNNVLILLADYHPKIKKNQNIEKDVLFGEGHKL